MTQPLDQNFVDSLAERLRNNDPTLTELTRNHLLKFERSPRFHTIQNLVGAISSEQWLQLVDAMRNNTVLKRIEIPGCGINDVGVQALAKILASNRHITYLNLDNNNIDFEGIQAITDALKDNQVLADLNLYRRQALFEEHQVEIMRTLVNLVKTTRNFRKINFPNSTITGSSPYNRVLRDFVDSVERNIFITVDIPDIQFHFFFDPKLCTKVQTLAIRSTALALLMGKKFTQAEIRLVFPRLPHSFPENANIPAIIFDSLIQKMENNTPDIAKNMYKNDAIHNVYRLVHAEKCMCEGDVTKCMLVLKQPFVSSVLQDIADGIMYPILRHATIETAFSTPKEKEILYLFHALLAWKKQDNAAWEIAKDALQELGVIDEGMDDQAFIEKLSVLERRIPEFRNAIFEKIHSLNLRPFDAFNPFSWFQTSKPSASDLRPQNNGSRLYSAANFT